MVDYFTDIFQGKLIGEYYDSHGHLVMNQNREFAEELSFNLESLSA